MTTDTNDRVLIAELERACLAAKPLVKEYSEQQFRYGRFQAPNLSKIAAPVVEKLSEHPELGVSQSHFFGQKQLLADPAYQGANLVRIAMKRGPEEALVWYRKVLSTKKADLRFSLEVHGLSTKSELRLPNNVTICPLHAVPASANGCALQTQFQVMPEIGGPLLMSEPVIFITEVSDVVARVDSDKSARDRKPKNAAESLRRTALAFTLVDETAPVPGISWTDFVDPDLVEAEFGRMWMGANYEGLIGRSLPTKIGETEIEWINRYIRLENHLKKVCDIAIHRLSQARRRRSPGDKAIDGAICLEALLGDRSSTTEVTYKLRLRAALLLADSYEERKKIRDCVNEFYGLRSRTVHGMGDEFSPSDEKIATEGLAICARTLQTVVSLNERLEPSQWELHGGLRSPQKDELRIATLPGSPGA